MPVGVCQVNHLLPTWITSGYKGFLAKKLNKIDKKDIIMKVYLSNMTRALENGIILFKP